MIATIRMLNTYVTRRDSALEFDDESNAVLQIRIGKQDAELLQNGNFA